LNKSSCHSDQIKPSAMFRFTIEYSRGLQVRTNRGNLPAKDTWVLNAQLECIG